MGESLKEKTNDSEIRKQQLQDKVDRVEEKYINEEISKEMYEKFRKKYESELNEIVKEIPSGEKNLSNLEKLVEVALEKAQNLSQYWISASYYKKQAFQKAVFPDKIYYHVQKGTYRTTKVNEALLAMASLTRVSGIVKSGIPSKKSKESHRVELVGFEPTSGQVGDKLSTCVVTY